MRKDNPFQIQQRIISAVLMREIIIRYGRHNIGFLWMAVEPMLFTLGVTALWTLGKVTHGSSLPITSFALTGYASVLLWRNTANRCSQAIRANMGLLHHAHVHVIHLFFARILLEIVGTTLSFILLSTVFITMGWMTFPVDMLLVLLGWFLLAWFGAALALILGSISERYESVERIWHTITYLLFPLSGAAFMVEWLPNSFQKLILFLPMVNGVELLRHGAFGSAVPTHYSITYLIYFCASLTILGLLMTKEANRHIGSA